MFLRPIFIFGPVYARITCVVRRHCAQIIVKAGSPVIGRFETMQLEEIIKKWKELGIIVRQDKQVHCQQVCTRLQQIIQLLVVLVSSKENAKYWKKLELFRY